MLHVVSWAKLGRGHEGRAPQFFQTVGIYYAMSPHIFLFKFCIWRDFKKESGLCHVLCEEIFMLDVRHSQVDAETEFDVVSLILRFFINFSFDKMIFSILQVSCDRERLLTASVQHFTLCGIL